MEEVIKADYYACEVTIQTIVFSDKNNDITNDYNRCLIRQHDRTGQSERKLAMT